MICQVISSKCRSNGIDAHETIVNVLNVVHEPRNGFHKNIIICTYSFTKVYLMQIWIWTFTLLQQICFFSRSEIKLNIYYVKQKLLGAVKGVLVNKAEPML